MHIEQSKIDIELGIEKFAEWDGDTSRFSTLQNNKWVNNQQQRYKEGMDVLWTLIYGLNGLRIPDMFFLYFCFMFNITGDGKQFKIDQIFTNVYVDMKSKGLISHNNVVIAKWDGIRKLHSPSISSSANQRGGDEYDDTPNVGSKRRRRRIQFYDAGSVGSDNDGNSNTCSHSNKRNRRNTMEDMIKGYYAHQRELKKMKNDQQNYQQRMKAEIQ